MRTAGHSDQPTLPRSLAADRARAPWGQVQNAAQPMTPASIGGAVLGSSLKQELSEPLPEVHRTALLVCPNGCSTQNCLDFLDPAPDGSFAERNHGEAGVHASVQGLARAWRE